MSNNFLENKVIYIVPTGAHKTKYFDVFLEQLKKYNPNIWILPTKMGESLLPNFEKMKINYNVKEDFSTDSTRLIPEEDIIVVAPCTFNTFNKIAMGIADSYPMSVIHNAIGKGKICIVAPAMDMSLWNNFTAKRNLAILQSQDNIKVVFPEYIYDSASNLQKITMAPYQKIIDTIIHCYTKIKYNNYCMDSDNLEIQEKYYEEFKYWGNTLNNEGYLTGNAGFLAKQISEGILVTASGSKVGQLNKEDLILVSSCENNIVFWKGTKCPSSEFPIIVELLNEFKNESIVIHGHCKEVTYNPNKNKYLTSEYISYGEWGQSKLIKPILYRFNGKAIMKLHGEIIIAKTFNEAKSKYEEMRYSD